MQKDFFFLGRIYETNFKVFQTASEFCEHFLVLNQPKWLLKGS